MIAGWEYVLGIIGLSIMSLVALFAIAAIFLHEPEPFKAGIDRSGTSVVCETPPGPMTVVGEDGKRVRVYVSYAYRAVKCPTYP